MLTTDARTGSQIIKDNPEIIKIELGLNEIELLLTALDQLPVKGIQAGKFVQITASKLEAHLPKDKQPEAVKMAVKK